MPFSILNGRLPDALLVHLGWPEAAYLRLRIDAAESLDRLAAAFEAHFGRPLRLTDAYRTFLSQVSLKIRKGKWAATPGTSNHGLGIAIDMASNINRDGSDEHQWMEQHGPAFGWVNPSWAEDWDPTNGQHEPWHWEYRMDLDTHPTPAPAFVVVGGSAPLEDAMTPDDFTKVREIFRDELLKILRAPEFELQKSKRLTVADIWAFVTGSGASADVALAAAAKESKLSADRATQIRNALTVEASPGVFVARKVVMDAPTPPPAP